MNIKKNSFSDKDIEILKRAIENENSVQKDKYRRYRVFFFYLAIMLINKYQKPKPVAYILNGKAELRYRNQAEYPLLYYGFFSNSVKDYCFSYMNISVIPYKKRLDYMLSSFVIGMKYGMPIGYVLDYLIWREYVKKEEVKQLINNGHYDRVSTMIAYLLQEYGKMFTIKQHGLLSANINLPNRIPATEVVAYDKKQERIFQNNIIDGDSCVFRNEYKLNVNFVKTPKNKVRIGIIQSPFKEMDEIIILVKKIFPSQEIWIMLHPLEKGKYSDSGNVKYIKGIKEFNFDVIISGPSTLVYDYVKSDFSNPIIAFDNMKALSGMDEMYMNVHIFESMSVFETYLKKVYTEITDEIRPHNVRASVAMAVFNGEKYINQQIDSILELMGEDDELVISYDESTDNTLEIIRQYERKDNRIKIVFDQGKSVESNFNSAVDACLGKYIFLSDQDDVWINDKINHMVNYFEKNEKSVVLISDGFVTDSELNTIESLFAYYHASASALRNFFKGSYCGCQMAFRSSIKEKVWPVLVTPPLPHDLWLGVKGRKYGTVDLISDKLILHRIHQNNYSNTSKMHLFQVLKNRLLFLKQLIKEDVS